MTFRQAITKHTHDNAMIVHVVHGYRRKSLASGIKLPIVLKRKYAHIFHRIHPRTNKEPNNILVIIHVLKRDNPRTLITAMEDCILLVMVVVAVVITIIQSNTVIISKMLVY